MSIKFCYHYLAELLDSNNRVVKRISGINLSETRIDSHEKYDDFSKLLTTEFREYLNQKVVITSLSFLHSVYDE